MNISLEDYIHSVVMQILQQIPLNLKKYTLGRTEEEQFKSILEMISEKRNEFGEYDTPYKNINSVSYAWECDESTKEYVQENIDEILYLLNGCASVI